MALFKVRRRIDSIYVDGIFNEEHVYRNEITNYPVENGSIINDHVISQPVTLSMQCSFNLSPIYNGDTLGGSGYSQSRENLTKLLDIAGYTFVVGNVQKTKTPQIIDVVTGLKSYDSMIISEIIFNDNNETIDTINFTIKLTQLKVVNEKFETVNNATTQNSTDKKVQKKINKGQVTPKVPKEKKISQLKSMLNKIKEWGN
jgi:hypothetical protein